MRNYSTNSLKRNMLLNAIKGMSSILFPLITFPYITRVLGVENIGHYNFANSIISYFILLAGLGISTYSVREGARIRDNPEKISLFASQMLSINLISTAISYCLLFFLVFFVPKFREYDLLIIILSLQIIFKTIGLEWIYSIYEEYRYITIRSIFFQFISLILLFLLVKTKDDLNLYALVIAISAGGSNLLNLFYSHKFCRLKLTKEMSLDIHLKPILVLFAMTATVTIYVSSDITILGFMVNDYRVGIYSVSAKVYSIVKTLLSSVLVVSIPRLASLLGKDNKKEFDLVANDIYKTLITIVAPCMVGIVVLKKEIVLLLATNEYIDATSSLTLLSISLFFCMGAWFWGQCILIPYKQEKIVFKATVVSAIVNILLNFLLIPAWQENAAALTTIIAEGVSFVWCGLKGKRIVKINDITHHYLKVFAGCMIIAVIGYLIHLCSFSCIVNIFIIVPCSIVFYFLFELLIKNDSVYSLFSNIKNRLT